MSGNTHLTWLDWYVDGAREKLEAESHLSIFPNVKSDKEAMFIMTMAAMEKATEVRDKGEERVSESFLALHLMYGAIAAFTVPDKLKAHLSGKTFMPPKALSISPSLAQDLAQADAPETRDWEGPCQRHTWYFDIPHRALMVGSVQIRAIFTQPVEQLGSTSGVLILTQPGSNEIAGRFTWMILGGVEHQSGGLSDLEVDKKSLIQSAENFIKLVWLYRLQVEMDSRPVYLPAVNESFVHLSRKKQKAKQKTHSMFKVLALSSPANRFGRERVPPKGQWILDYRTSVRPHFRWQPYGPRSQLRKLIWIERHYRGPLNAEEKIDLEKLA